MKLQMICTGLLFTGIFASCSGKTEEKKEPVRINIKIQDSLKVTNGSLPTGKCLPLELSTVDSSFKPIASDEVTVSLIATFLPAVQKGGIGPTDESPKVPLYSDDQCNQETATSLLTSVNGAPNKSIIFAKSLTEGLMRVGARIPASGIWLSLGFKDPPATP